MMKETVNYHEEVIEAEYSSEGYVIVNYARSYNLNRILVNGKWVIVTDLGKTINEVTPGKEFEPCESYVHTSVKMWIESEKLLEILKGIVDSSDIDIKLVSKKVSRRINMHDIKECKEEKVVNYVRYNDMSFAYTGDPHDIPSIIEYLKTSIVNIPSKRLLTESGRVTFILDPEVAGHVFHHLVLNYMRGNAPAFKINEKIFGEITIYDNPLNPFSHSFSYFDDEGVRTRKKELIGDGIIINYLGTLTSKFGNAGNARGLLPKPDYFTLEFKTGDWKLDEMIQESKGSYLAIGVKRSEMVQNSVRIYPRSVIKVGEGRVFIREVAIPLQDLLSIDAITRETKGVFIDEEHGGVMPYIRMKARAILY
ncbi:peptidase U62 [Sulfolobus sp. A20]|uniref:metallopeptidase TldD-related protein n=1 Tax=Sulfolobaceae TaxID=118883 RepID=UPI000845EF52|nr:MULTISPECIES: metallopeptidase TldD-related protein [unclassified Sulfolobus]TRM78566.1 peptidase U62 [Sulfolobus sp. A20-N-F8]TRM83172.1 peptidase U62 [Sulfolobus sp. A20-N-F6]TRM83419.1 peptidase U62 [Sulfolobus sp. F3]TRM87565.1 peptidase U62 [Sulfolobus sp. C3]TRM99374.1 peptidase U62 [Sulfolobus sp. E1]